MSKEKFFIIIGAIIIVTAAALQFISWQTERGSVTIHIGSNAFSEFEESEKQVEKIKFKVKIADTPNERRRGLSNYEFLKPGEGMLFVFTRADYYSFWMKDMKFPIDIIWIRGDRIVDISENALPASGGNLITYKPREQANFILEINAGLTEKYGIKVGDKIDIDI